MVSDLRAALLRHRVFERRHSSCRVVEAVPRRRVTRLFFTGFSERRVLPVAGCGMQGAGRRVKGAGCRVQGATCRCPAVRGCPSRTPARRPSGSGGRCTGRPPPAEMALLQGYIHLHTSID